MQNEILNATGLDGVTDWSSTLGGLLTVDDTLVGRPGVIVNASTKLAAAAGAKVDLITSSVSVTLGERLELMIYYAAAGGRASLELEVVNGGGVVQAKKAILPSRASSRTPRAGVPSDFNYTYIRIPAPATGFARLRVIATAFGGHDLAAYAMRPFLDAGELPTSRQFWAAGHHTNPDLDLPAWPSFLPQARTDFGVDPLGRRKSFTGDSKVPGFREISSTTRWIARASYRLDVRQRAQLDAFYADTTGQFYFVRPDTLQICRAQWTEAEPKDTGSGPDRETAVELLLEVA